MESTAPTSSSVKKEKLAGYDFYRRVLGSPKYVVAPMVDQSELAFRRLCRDHGADLVYTPMINVKMFTDPINKTYRSSSFDIASGEEGELSIDRPLIVQFCANDPEKLLRSAQIVEPHCDAVDINLGCPQEIAKRGRYGSFLQDDWELIFKLINTLHTNLSIPVTAKFRVFPDLKKTVEYAQMLERAGAQLLTCHGRIREQRGQRTGLADWRQIRAVKEAVKVPVFANGNILFQEDIQRCLDETGCDGVSSAEGVLYNPALYHGLGEVSTSSTAPPLLEKLYPPHTRLAKEYLDIVQSQRTKTPVSAVKGHLFKLMRPAFGREKDLRERMGNVGMKGNDKSGEKERKWMEECYSIVEEMRIRMERDANEFTQNGSIPLQDLIAIDEATGLRLMPHWLAQPYFRPLPTTPVVPKEKKGPNQQEAKVTEVEVLDELEVQATLAAKRTLEEGGAGFDSVPSVLGRDRSSVPVQDGGIEPKRRRVSEPEPPAVAAQEEMVAVVV